LSYGSEADPFAYRRTRSLRIHGSSRSKSLRSNSPAECAYCGTPVEWYDRHDLGRIPLLPRQFPTRSVPHRHRWQVDGGIAYPGDLGAADCYIPHPAVCPAIEHEDLELQVLGIKRVLGLAMRKRMNHGFLPRLVPTGETTEAEAEVADPEPDPSVLSSERHVLEYNGLLRLLPSPLYYSSGSSFCDGF
jgi:hypothetical protein